MPFVLSRTHKLIIDTALGKRVALTYRQHVGVPTSCFGDTEYYVGDVKVLE